MEIKLIQPENGGIVSQLSQAHKDFLATGGNREYTQEKLDWLNLQRQGEDYAYPEPVIFRWEIAGTADAAQKVCLTVADNEALRNSDTYICAENEYRLYNLLLGQTYYWKISVCHNDAVLGSSPVHCFMVDPQAPRWIKAGGLSNVRDIGGWQTIDGKTIQQGLVYRGCEMEFHHCITEDGKRVLTEQLKIKTDLDLRGEAVGKIEHSALGNAVELALIPAKAYDSFLEEKDVCKQIFRLFTEEKNYPFYIHCWGGADRTGTLIFLLCGILGMKTEDLFLDYELTSFCIWGGRSIKSDLFLGFMKALNTYGGESDSIQEKCVRYLLDAGLTQGELDKIRAILLR